MLAHAPDVMDESCDMLRWEKAKDEFKAKIICDIDAMYAFFRAELISSKRPPVPSHRPVRLVASRTPSVDEIPLNLVVKKDRQSNEYPLQTIKVYSILCDSKQPQQPPAKITTASQFNSDNYSQVQGYESSHSDLIYANSSPILPHSNDNVQPQQSQVTLPANLSTADQSDVNITEFSNSDPTDSDQSCDCNKCQNDVQCAGLDVCVKTEHSENDIPCIDLVSDDEETQSEIACPIAAQPVKNEALNCPSVIVCNESSRKQIFTHEQADDSFVVNHENAHEEPNHDRATNMAKKQRIDSTTSTFTIASSTSQLEAPSSLKIVPLTNPQHVHHAQASAPIPTILPANAEKRIYATVVPRSIQQQSTVPNQNNNSMPAKEKSSTTPEKMRPDEANKSTQTVNDPNPSSIGRLVKTCSGGYDPNPPRVKEEFSGDRSMNTGKRQTKDSATSTDCLEVVSSNCHMEPHSSISESATSAKFQNGNHSQVSRQVLRVSPCHEERRVEVSTSAQSIPPSSMPQQDNHKLRAKEKNLLPQGMTRPNDVNKSTETIEHSSSNETVILNQTSSTVQMRIKEEWTDQQQVLKIQKKVSNTSNITPSSASQLGPSSSPSEAAPLQKSQSTTSQADQVSVQQISDVPPHHTEKQMRAEEPSFKLNHTPAVANQESQNLLSREEAMPPAKSAKSLQIEAASISESSSVKSKYSNASSKFKIVSIHCLEQNCPQEFSNDTELRLHMINAHQINPHICPSKHCDQSFTSRNLLVQHFDERHSDSKKFIRCHRCNLVNKDLAALLDHTYYQHYPGLFRCTATVCGFETKFRYYALRHYETIHYSPTTATSRDYVERRESCSSSSDQSMAEGSMVGMRRRNENEEVAKSSSDQSDLPPDEEPIPCKFVVKRVKCFVTDCHLMFANEKSHAEHMESKHDIWPVLCPLKWCGKTYRARDDLECHIRKRHTNITKWKCIYCDEDQSTSDELYLHVKFHHREGHFECSYEGCPFVGKYRAAVVDHYDRAHLSARCRHCGRCFITKAKLNDHQCDRPTATLTRGIDIEYKHGIKRKK